MSLLANDCACVVVNTKSRRKVFDKTLLLSAAAFALITSPAVQANPVGGAVTTGSATVSTSSNKTSVNQKSEDVVIDWSSFNIGAGQTTQFVQPNSSAIAVNRVGGVNASQILGTLDANGRVVLINGNGVLFGKGAQVNVGSLIATSTDGSDSDVLSGKFTQAGKQSASVINNGAIAAASGGTVALVAPNVSNTGTVNAKLGTVALGAANKFTVDFAGDGLVSFAAQGDVNARASAINSGLLSGANVSMTAHAANGIATGIVNMSGIVTAQGAQNVGGTIYLNAGNGTLTTTGTLNAAGVTGGGQIETSGHVVNISGQVIGGKGGLWKVDPEDLTIDFTAAGTIDGALAGGTSVVEQTTSGAASGAGNQTAGAGDINVESPMSWGTSATLTLDSYHSINILAPISIVGAGNLVLQYNDAATDGTLSFGLGHTGFAGNVSYGATNNGGTLTINGAPYTLLYSMSDVHNINNGLTGNYALADFINASGTTGWIPLGTDGAGNTLNGGEGFTGVFEGLGNTISNLTINLPGANSVGLFGWSSGTLRDVGLVGGSVTAGQFDAGQLAGVGDGGLIANDYATGSVSDTSEGAGGLVGTQENGAITGSFATGAVNGSSYVGGLVGDGVKLSNLTITDSYATGTITGTANVGGLVGLFNGTLTGSYATGAVFGQALVGGLVGGLGGGSIADSYATGAVTGSGNTTSHIGMGGLVGGVTDNPVTISDSFATGQVSGPDYSAVGGLVGELTVDTTISDSYATGAVTGSSGVGGLVGETEFSDFTLTNTFAVGHVTGTSFFGGLVGEAGSGGVDNVTGSYWDKETSGQNADGTGMDGLTTGLKTVQLQAALPSGFTGPTWSIVPGVSFPYLTWQVPSGTPQVLAGTVYGTDGKTEEAGLGVTALIDGTQVSPLVATTSGANGYYYLLLAPGTISSSGSPIFAYVGGSAPGASYVANAIGSDGALEIVEDEERLKSGASSVTGLARGEEAALGGNLGLLFSMFGSEPNANLFLDDSAPNFNIDSPINAGTGTFWFYDPNGALTESGSGLLGGAITAGLFRGTTANGVTLNGANEIARLGQFTNTGSGGFFLTNGDTLHVTGPINAGTGDLSLTTTANDIVLGGDLTAGGTVSLVAGSGIWQNPKSSIITADALTGSANGATLLQGANLITNLGDFDVNAADFRLTNNQTLTVTGTVGANGISLDTTSGDLVDSGALHGNMVTLVSSLGEVDGTGNIDATVLNVTADTGIDLDGADNDITHVRTDTTSSGPNVIDTRPTGD